MTRVLYPGSFDPITKGHMNIIKQASELFDEVVVAILINSQKKNSFFTTEERKRIIDSIYKEINNVQVVVDNQAAVDVALNYQCDAIVRGLRNLTDFEYEIELARINRDISEDKINTICLFADANLANVSSSVVKEIFGLNKSIEKYVDPLVVNEMNAKKKVLK